MSRNPNMQSLTDADFIALVKRIGLGKTAKQLQVPLGTAQSRATKLKVNSPKSSNKGKKYGSIKEISNKEFAKDVSTLGVEATAKLYKVARSTVQRRIVDAEIKLNTSIVPPQAAAEVRNGPDHGARAHPQRFEFAVQNGVVLVFSDAHYWPGKPSVTHRALVKLAHEMEPAAIICNGDAVDMAAVSRHPPIGWETRPTVQQEIECAQDRLGEIIKACTKNTIRAWNLGNHDARFETRLASVAPEYAKVAGIHLHDHFNEWERAWSTWINGDVVIKHRYKGGIHATHNNAVTSGKTIVTGHLHSAKVTPFTDYDGTRFGVDTGCLADTWGSQFTNYLEDNPRNWVSAFGVLTFRHGKLLWPELVVAYDEQSVQFRGKIIEV